jgi:hypothetical protein
VAVLDARCGGQVGYLQRGRALAADGRGDDAAARRRGLRLPLQADHEGRGQHPTRRR